MKNKISLILFSALIGFHSCSRQPHEEQEKSSTDSANIVELTSEQMNYAEIEIGKFTKKLVTDKVECNGSIEADPNQQAMVSVPMQGYIKKILVHIGDYVNKGETLAVLEHGDYVKLQQEYLEVKSQYEYYKEDFKRQGELTLENATSLKIMQQAQNEFRKTEARFYALNQQLSLLGIKADSLTVTTMTSKIELKSPVQGYVTEVNGQIGMLCTEEDHVFAVVGTQNTILHLKVYEKDASRISKGQLIEFSLISQPDRNYKAKISAATRSIDENNTINLHARILDISNDMMPGMYVNASILVNADSVYSLRNEAIITSEGIHYIFRKLDSTRFESIEIQTGRNYNDQNEILNLTPELLHSEIVVSGAYYLFSELIKEE